MVLSKELHVCNYNLQVIVIEDNKEKARGNPKDLIDMCISGSLPRDAFVKSVDIILHSSVGKGRFRALVLNKDLEEDTPYLAIKVKRKLKDCEVCSGKLDNKHLVN